MARIRNLFYSIVVLYFSILPKWNYVVNLEDDWDEDDIHMFI